MDRGNTKRTVNRRGQNLLRRNGAQQRARCIDGAPAAPAAFLLLVSICVCCCESQHDNTPRPARDVLFPAPRWTMRDSPRAAVPSLITPTTAAGRPGSRAGRRPRPRPRRRWASRHHGGRRPADICVPPPTQINISKLYFS
jgi:hypothetical protein